MSKSPDRRRKTSRPESAKPEPLGFLTKCEPVGGEIRDDTLGWLDYDPSEEAMWPDLSAHGFNLGIAVLPSGKMVDVARPIDLRHGDVRARIATEKVLHHELGFRAHPSGVMFRLHRSVHVEEFAEHFPMVRAATLPLKDFVRVPSRENPDFFENFRTKQRRFPGPMVTDGKVIMASYRRFRDQEFEHVGEFGRGGLGWVEIKTSEQAKYAAEVSMTSIDVQFEAEKRDNKGRPAPHRWFMLVTAATNVFEGKLVMVVPGPGFRRRRAVMHVDPVYAIAQGGTDSCGEWAPEIENLAAAVNDPVLLDRAGKVQQMGSDPEEPSSAPALG